MEVAEWRLYDNISEVLPLAMIRIHSIYLYKWQFLGIEYGDSFLLSRGLKIIAYTIRYEAHKYLFVC